MLKINTNSQFSMIIFHKSQLTRTVSFHCYPDCYLSKWMIRSSNYTSFITNLCRPVHVRLQDFIVTFIFFSLTNKELLTGNVVDNLTQKVLCVYIYILFTYNAYLGYIFYYLVTFWLRCYLIYTKGIFCNTVLGNLENSAASLKLLKNWMIRGKKRTVNNFLSTYANTILKNQKIVLDSTGHKLGMDLIHKFHCLLIHKFRCLWMYA